MREYTHMHLDYRDSTTGYVIFNARCNIGDIAWTYSVRVDFQ